MRGARSSRVLHAVLGQDEEMSEELRRELVELRRFCTAPFYGQQDRPIALVTAAKYDDHLRCGLRGT